MICRYCFNKTKDQDFYCRVCGHRTEKMPQPDETLLTPLVEEKKEIKEEQKKKSQYKNFYIFAGIILAMFLIIIIYLVILILKNKL